MKTGKCDEKKKHTGWTNQEIEFQYRKVMETAKIRKEYFVFRGKDLAAARTFLLDNPVSSWSVCFVVITPEGILCADAEGIEQIPIMTI